MPMQMLTIHLERKSKLLLFLPEYNKFMLVSIYRWKLVTIVNNGVQMQWFVLTCSLRYSSFDSIGLFECVPKAGHTSPGSDQD
jgi:hypothetical protein